MWWWDFLSYRLQLSLEKGPSGKGINGEMVWPRGLPSQLTVFTCIAWRSDSAFGTNHAEGILDMF